mmetsp:Transcript_46242/g.136576  ORF Transcript_46242/g.136576 Transcript_46242/m.136576 type:complete len:285 (-) Transcript_46242:1021-1875(-)
MTSLATPSVALTAKTAAPARGFVPRPRTPRPSPDRKPRTPPLRAPSMGSRTTPLDALEKPFLSASSPMESPCRVVFAWRCRSSCSRCWYAASSVIVFVRPATLPSSTPATPTTRAVVPPTTCFAWRVTLPRKFIVSSVVASIRRIAAGSASTSDSRSESLAVVWPSAALPGAPAAALVGSLTVEVTELAPPRTSRDATSRTATARISSMYRLTASWTKWSSSSSSPSISQPLSLIGALVTDVSALSGPISRLVGLYGCIAGASHSGASCAVSVMRIGSSLAWCT